MIAIFPILALKCQLNVAIFFFIATFLYCANINTKTTVIVDIKVLLLLLLSLGCLNILQQEVMPIIISNHDIKSATH